jgi:hypothetical protein
MLSAIQLTILRSRATLAVDEMAARKWLLMQGGNAVNKLLLCATVLTGTAAFGTMVLLAGAAAAGCAAMVCCCRPSQRTASSGPAQTNS